MFALHVGAVLHHVPAAATWIVQEGGGAMATDPLGLWHAMGWVAKTVVIILFIMSGWSIGVMIDRWMAYSAARKQSRAFGPAVAGALRDGRIDEAIKVAERNKKSHLAKVVTAGLMEFKAHQDSPGAIPGETIEASKRALERTEAIVHAELKRGLGGLATIGSTAPFVGLFGTVMGILNAFIGINNSKATSEINVTPMVDVMLVLLIIFMVVTPMLQKGISVDMAKVNNPEQMPDADKEDALLVSITRDGQVYFGSEQIKDVDNLTTKVKDRLANKADKRVYVKADMRTRFGGVVRVVDSVRAAGVDDLGLLTDQRKTKTPPPAPPAAAGQ